MTATTPASVGESALPCRLLPFLERHTGVGHIQHETELGAGLGLDSLGIVDLLSAIEAEFGLDLAGVRADEHTTVGELAGQVSAGVPAIAGYKAGRWPLTRPIIAVRVLLQCAFLFPLLAVLSRRQARGAEHLRGLQGPVLFAANHLSLLDNPAVLLALPWRWRLRLATAASDHVLDQRGRFQRIMAILISNAFPLSQTHSVRASMEYCHWLVDRGWSVLYFPEGMRSDDGSMLPFGRGVGRLAVDLGLPVVPVYLRGTNDVIPKGAAYPRRGLIQVTFGEPLCISAGHTDAEATEAIRMAIASLADPGQR